MKCKKIILSSLLMLTGCSQAQTITKTDTEPTLELSQSRVQVAVNKSFNYQSFIKTASDKEDGDMVSKVEYTDIETSKSGSYQVDYSLKDSDHHEVRKSLKVDVVKMDDKGIYNPLDVTPDTIENPDDITALFNKINQIPKGWVPNDLEPVLDNKSQKLRKEANVAYTKFYNDAKAKGINIYSISGYRTNDTQTLYWNNQVKVRGEQYASMYSAYPGRSEHQLGLAIDISYTTTGNRLNETVATSPLGKFIISDAYKYGFIIRYPKDKIAITNYAYEPWHMRYVGVELATKLNESGITLEEYYNQ
ncbi:MAG: M15 family metallopeptidase [Coprobacillus sp.]